MPLETTDAGAAALKLAQEAFINWLAGIDKILKESEQHFDNFTQLGLRRELKAAGEELANAEAKVKQARAELGKLDFDE